MSLIYRIEELIKKAILTLRKKGLKETFRKVRIFLTRDLMGRNFSLILSRGSYSFLWKKVFETYRTKGLLVFLVRFLLALLFGWVVFFITPKVIDFVPDKKFFSWYAKNKRKVSIVIPTYEDFDLTNVCVESIYKYSDPSFIEIIVADDGSSKEIQEKLKELKVTLVLNAKNGGFAKTVNSGIRKAKSTDIILLNNDTLVTKGWIEALQYWAYSDPSFGVVGPKLLYPDQTIQWAGTFRNDLEPDWFDHYYKNQSADFSASEYSHPVLAATGACMYIKKEVIDKVGLLDENYLMAFEDVDYSLRVWQEGYKVIYCPKAIVTHLESKTRGRRQGERELSSKDYFWNKWRAFFDERSVTNKKGKLEIIYVNQDNGVGGGTRVIFEHLNRLQERGHSVSLYTITPAPDWFDLKVPVKVFKNYSLLIEDLKIKEAIKVATWWETAETVWEASIEKGIPVFFVQDIESSYYNGDKEYQNKVLSSYRKEFNYLTVSGWDKERLAEIGVEATVVNPGINEIFERKNLKRNQNELLAIGRSNSLKNFDLTVQAYKLITKKLTLKLFGIEPRLGKVLGVDYVYKPTDKEVVALYNEAGAFIQTSLHEGFCLPALEAMACGCPVITTDSHGNRDFCVDGKNCLMVSTTDAKDVAKKIEKIFSDSALREKLITEGLKTAKEYAWGQKINELENYYKNLS